MKLTILTAVLMFPFLVQAHPPTGIVVDKKGNVFFTDLETIWKLDVTGKLSIVRPGVSGRHVHELSIDKDGNVYGADLSYEGQKWISDVWKLASDGQLSYLFQPISNPLRGVSIWQDDQRNMYYVEQDNRTKSKTLILRRTPAGTVTTLAGGAFGQRDGKGESAMLGSVGGLAFGPDGSLYFTDGTSLRRVTMDGEVTTLAKDLTKRSKEDRALLFGKNDGILTGLTVDSSGVVFLADAGNQRLLKVSNGKVEVVYRGEDPYYTNGVVAAPGGELYTLEVGYKPPSTWLPVRVRKIGVNGENSIVATAGLLLSNSGIEENRRADGGITSYRFSTVKYVGVAAFIAVAMLVVWRQSLRTKRA